MAGMIVHLKNRDGSAKDVEVPNFYVPPEAVECAGRIYIRSTPESERDATYTEATFTWANDPSPPDSGGQK